MEIAQNTPNFSPTRASIAGLLLLVVAFLCAHELSTIVLPRWEWMQISLHSGIEAIGILSAFLLARLILLLPQEDERVAGRRLWVASALVAVGILDVFHAAVPPGNLFVWLQSLSLLMGGTLFALVWLPVRVRAAYSYALPLATAVASGMLGLLSIEFRVAIPAELAPGGFTGTATVINLVGGLLFLFAAARFVIGYRASGESEDLVFAALTLLFGLSEVFFEYSRVWNEQYWFWHLLRLIAYLIAVRYVLHLFRQAQVMLAHTNAALQREILEHRQSQQRYRSLFETMDQGVVYQAADGVITDANPAAERILGLTKDELQGMTSENPFWHAIHEDGSDFPGDTHPSMVALRTGQAVHDVLMGVSNPKHNGRCWLLINAVPQFRTGEARPYQVYTTFTDVTARLEAQEALRESEADLKRAQSVARVGNWRLDARQHDLYWSDETYRMFGIPKGTPMTYERFLESVHPDDREFLKNRWQLTLRGAPYDVEHRIVVDGEVRWVRERAELEFDANGTLLSGFGTVQEITARKLAEEELRRKSEELKRLNAELEEFAYIASHDLKAPLRAVANLAFVIDEDVSDGLDDENRRRLQLLRERVRAMDALIEGLLSYARLGQSTQERTTVELGDLLRELIADLDIPPGIEIELSEPLPALFANPLQLWQIFQNLISNAIENHDRSEGHVWVKASDGGDAWLLEVIDDGPGIPDDAKARVFGMFSTSGKPGHTGIGLAVARKIILGNGGQIEVADNRPRGAIFRVRWPK